MRHLHLGLGRFHRAHQAFYLQNKGIPISAFSMRSPDEAEALRRGDHSYRLVVVGNGREEVQTIIAIDEALFIRDARERFLELMASEDVSTVTLTVTEKGYCARADGSLNTEHPDLEHSVLNDLVCGLRARQKHNRKPLAVLSCDNLSANGRMLQRLCQTWSEKSGQSYDRSLVSFPNSMVDRIVPAGDDPLTIKTEAFHQWVIEDRFVGGYPHWEQKGLIFVKEVEPFERMKLCLLNASHSFLAYYGQLQGHDYVHQAIADPAIRQMVERLCLEEVGPCLDIPDPWTLEGYVSDMLSRFDNPGLPHKLSQIAMDGTQKVPHRFLPYLEQSSVLRKALSAWYTYYYEGLTQPGRYLVSDPMKDQLAASATDDKEATAAEWKRLLGWKESFG
ncbi:MAG: mannitol dehydrogenase family protein [Candidatus Eremiobacteraeota bacterium]|nr:mannitol dehydrogenase family protein [Candidatus Eremiobacteraeota bacterium]